jgi:hypothetical protein
MYCTTLYNIHMRKAATFRLTGHAQRLLNAMAEADGISHTAMLEIAIREAARKRGIHADTGIQTQNQSGTTHRD